MVHQSETSGNSLDRYQNIINGELRESENAESIEVVCPSDGLPFATISRSGPIDIDLAVRWAREAFENEWSRFTATERGRLLAKLGEIVLSRKAELGALESQDTGKPLRQGLADIEATARYFEFYGTAADKFHGDTIPFLQGYTVAVMRDPHGVTGHIVPWNYPSQIFGRSVGASLACGNTCVVKPAEDAGLTLHRIAELALEAGFPEGVLNVVSGLGPEAGAALAGHPGLDFISFTGSPDTGTLVQAAAAKNHTGCTLELGGKSPQIVFADADLESALPVLFQAIVQNGGQTCSAGSRVLVERPLFEEVTRALAERFSSATAGPHDQDLDLGAMINPAQRERVNTYVQEALEEGVPMIAEGRVASSAPDTGYYVKPAMFSPVDAGSRLARDEVFGPVLSIMPFRDEQEAVEIANGTDYGLVAGVWTNNGSRAMRVARAMRCGQVFVNGYGAGGGIELPFGGVGKSGHGREKGFEALYEFSATKTIVINHQ